ncbi:MAG: phage portal protein [Clostridia bacterium]|nr:phage portal protein [Clostridia bacterium]
MKVMPAKRAVTPGAQRRDVIAPWIIGTSDDLSVPGYTRLIDSPDVAAAAGKTADIISNATIWLMRNTKAGDVRQNTALAKKIDIAPYSLGTRKTWMSWIVFTMLTSGDGNSLVLPITENGYIQDLKPMPNASLLPVNNGDSYRALWKSRYFDPDDILHFVLRAHPTEPWRGMGVRLQLRDVLKNLRQAATTTNAFMSDKWKPSVIVKVDALADEFADEAGRSKLLEEYIKTQHAGEPWVIPADLMEVTTVKPLSLADLAIADSIKLDKRAVAAAFGVPQYFVGIGDFNRDEYNNFVRTTAIPIATGIAQELTKKLLLSPDLYFKFNTRRLYAYDMKDLAQIGMDLFVRGIDTGNEVRDWIEQSPVEGLDERIILENYIPADMISKQKKLVQKEE